MIAHSQPITFHTNSGNINEYHGSLGMPMDVGSYTGESSGTFNPASFTRHFLGSPISWRTSSYGMSSRIPAGSPTAQFLNSIDVNEYRSGKMPSSLENDSVMNALTVFDREGELCRNYTCCGQNLNDLHALLEHFEQVHIVVIDPSLPPSIQVPFRPMAHDPNSSLPLPSQQELQEHIQTQYQIRHQAQMQQHHQQRHQQQQLQHQMNPYPSSFDEDDMELDIDLGDHPSPIAPLPSHPMPHPQSLVQSQGHRSSSSPSSCATTPPDTPISTPLSAYPSPRAFVTHHLGAIGGGVTSQHQQYNQQHHQQGSTFSGSNTAIHSPFVSAPPSPLSSQASAYDPDTSTAASTRQNSPTHDGVPSGMTMPQGGVMSGMPFNMHMNLNLSYGPLNGSSAHSLHPLHGQSHLNPLPRNGVNVEDAFNPYARFASDYSSTMPGAQFNGASCDEASVVLLPEEQQIDFNKGEGCVPPALLFASVGGDTSRKESKHHSPTRANASSNNSNSSAGLSSTRPIASTASASGLASSSSHSHPSLLPSASIIPASSASTPHGASNHGSSVAPPPLLLSKPFRCPKPNCNKSYKQANGLKYHLTHGSCNFAPPKDLEHVKELLERRRREKELAGQLGQPTTGAGGLISTQNNGGSVNLNGNAAQGQAQAQGQHGANLTRSASLGSQPSGGNAQATAPIPTPGASSSHTTPSTPTSPSFPCAGPSNATTIGQSGLPLSPSSILHLSASELSSLSESDLREIEREAERRLRPFACGVGDCQRRYKNMNGLRYHYQHSGEHGMIGMGLLARGLHECLGGRRGQNQGNGHGAQGHRVGGTAGVVNGGSQGGAGGPYAGPGHGRGSISVPVSRAPSVPGSRMGTPPPQMPTQAAYALPHSHLQQQQTQKLIGGLSMAFGGLSATAPTSPTHSRPGSTSVSPLPSPNPAVATNVAGYLSRTQPPSPVQLSPVSQGSQPPSTVPSPTPSGQTSPLQPQPQHALHQPQHYTLAQQQQMYAQYAQQLQRQYVLAAMQQQSASAASS
ncbi:hypothetical protein CPB83DRAFT_839820 [Crepidotus variabilis]|uniref:C2H2-type domain-containing protein n=1 Tax=Crepidotus variabilis TaxID=179855 RepID=A0A9P6JJX5_9AGAR|nr:hypothetical protein CPB83DRAFT_839820 [Crepidotus variabilis]